MELFSEVFGAYYQMVSYLLRLCGKEGGGMSEEEIRRLTVRMGFAETSMYLIPKLLGKDGWPLLAKTSEQPVRWKSRLHHLPKRPVTMLECRWLSAAISDPKAPLFLSYEMLGRLTQALAGVAPLYMGKDFRYFDRYLDGDPYRNTGYQKNFRAILSALQEGRAMEITYRTGVHDGMEESRVHRGIYLPLQLEFSEKDDKFRVYCKRLHRGRFVGYATINLGRILSVSYSRERWEDSGEAERMRVWLKKQRCEYPVEVEVSQERNGIERFLVEFSSYEKETWMEQPGLCRVKIWYQKADETEVLIRILGFGPVVKVLGPEPFLRQVRDRVQMQMMRLERTAQLREPSESSDRK